MAERDWLTDLPDEIRTRAAEDLSRLDTLQQERDEAKRYEEFYNQTYLPWVKDHGTTFQAYEREKDAFNTWRAARQSTPPAATSPASPQAAPIDWDAPNAVEQVYQDMTQRLERERTERVAMRQEFEVERDNMLRMLALQEQAYGLVHGEIFGHLEARDNWKPQTDIRAVAQHARDRGFTDLQVAHRDLYADTQRKAAEEAAYQRGLQDAALRQARETVTTEMSEGAAPILSRRPAAGAPRGYGNTGMSELMQAIAERRQSRRQAAG